MAKIWNKAVNRVVLQVLTWLGIGSTSLIFMACYGPAPQNYGAEVDEDTIAVVVGDSVTTVDMASTEAEPVEGVSPEAE